MDHQSQQNLSFGDHISVQNFVESLATEWIVQCQAKVVDNVVEYCQQSKGKTKKTCLIIDLENYGKCI